jgi:LacI family transcriptional regulator
MRETAIATIRDVARASNVSIATVSRVFNKSPLVSEETRQRVTAAASALGYWPNEIARSLITNRTHTLGLLLPDLYGDFFSEVIHGVDFMAREKGFHLLVSRSSSNAEELNEVLRSMRGRVDGLVVMAPDLDASRALRHAAGSVPVVLLNPEVQLQGCDTVSIGNFQGAYAMVRHLAGLGHHPIATITGPTQNIDARQRLDGYRAALRDVGLEADPDLEFHGNFTERSGYEAALELMRQRARPTAVFVANDHMAVGVMGALQEAGRQVPDDIALGGFDDIAMARYLTPALTTVHVDMLQMGERAVELLVDPERATGVREGRHDVLSTRLVIRASCGASRPHGAGPAWDRGDPVPFVPR